MELCRAASDFRVYWICLQAGFISGPQSGSRGALESNAGKSAVGDVTTLTTPIRWVTGPELNRSPQECEPVSSRRFATWRGKEILRPETVGGHRHRKPKI
jgi:hypothetical protein